MSGSGPLRELTRNRKVEVALRNEYLTRERVDQLERDLLRLEVHLEKGLSCEPDGGLHQLAVWQNTTWRIVMERGFWGRLSWLLRGR